MANLITQLGTLVEGARAKAHNQARSRFAEKHLPKGGVGAELGVHKGYFTEVLLASTKPTKLHLVDPWYLGGPEWTWGRGNRSTVDGLRRVLDVTRAALAAGQAVVHVSGDLEFLQALPDNSLDWAYIDTTHAYEHTRLELALLQTKVKPSGVIAGDDWRSDPSHRHHGVCKAVREFVAAGAYVIAHGSDEDNQWAIRRAG
jgi:Methyltransferase domain